MRYRIKTHQDFDKEFKRLCKKYSSLKADLSALGKSLSENPDQGTVILLTIYDKADRDSISAAEIDELLRSLRWEL